MVVLGAAPHDFLCPRKGTADSGRRETALAQASSSDIPRVAYPESLTSRQAARVKRFTNAEIRWRRISLRALSSVVM
jgi:hypothetical protein